MAGSSNFVAREPKIGGIIPPDPLVSVPPVSFLREEQSIRLTSGARRAIKKTYEEPRGPHEQPRFRHEERTGGAAHPDRGARRQEGAASGECGRRGDRRLARRRPDPGAGACGDRAGGRRFRGGALRAPARAGPVVRRRRRSLSSPSSPGVRRSRPGPAPLGDGPHGWRDGGARGGGNGASRAGARRGGGRDGRGGGGDAFRARPPAPARGRGRRGPRLRVPGPGA